MRVSSIVTFLSAAMMVSAAPSAEPEAALEERSYGTAPAHIQCASGWGWYGNPGACCRTDCWYSGRCNPHPRCNSGEGWYGQINKCCRNDCWYGGRCNSRPRCNSGYSWTGEHCCSNSNWWSNECHPHPRSYYGKA